jgi:hypothetical protein
LARSQVIVSVVLPSMRGAPLASTIKHIAAKPRLSALNCIKGLQAESKTRR